MSSPTLSIYSASAGSGKTYTLAMRFVDLLIRNPRDYQHIMAVTFTVKATNEMKERILENLFTLAFDDHADEGVRRKREGLLASQRSLFEQRGETITDAEIATACRQALLLFLNDYSQFNILTIDSFVQKVIRAFAYEAGLPAEYRVSLDRDQIIDSAISELFRDMKTDEDFASWMKSYVGELMKEGKKWNRFDAEIRKMCQNVFGNDEVEKVQLSMSELKEFFDKVKAINDAADKKIVSNLKQLKETLAAIPSIGDALNGGKRLSHIMKREGNELKKYFVDRMAPDDAMPKFKDCFRKGTESFCASNESQLSVAEKLYLELCDDDFVKTYFTTKAIREDFYAFGLWSSVSRHIRAISQRENEMPISESNELLHKLIDGSDVPFIYEKIGARFKNIMIDEFQDTSRVQWENFRPLVRESLSQGNEALIVGDVKQAIYRWRQSDWRLLAGEVEQTFSGQTQRIALATNYRSDGNVIRFNNAFFDRLKMVVKASDAEEMYKECAQQVPDYKQDKNDGYVCVRLFENGKKEGDDNEATLDEMRATQLVETIKTLRTNGYAYSDICILIRQRRDSNKFLGALSEAGIPVVSSDSLLVNNSPAVRAIVSHMKFIDNPNNDVMLMHAMSFEGEKMPLEQMRDKLDEMKLVAKSLSGLGLIEMTSEIVNRLSDKVIDEQYVYIEAFKNCVYNYTRNGRANLGDFLEFYEQKSTSLSVEAPDNQDAVQLMTIHKSKGLQFKAVLLPVADWSIKSNPDSLLWCELPAPFDGVGKLPLKQKENLKKTFVRDAYLAETEMCSIDNLNLLYVALTRAEKALYIWSAKRSNKDSEHLSSVTHGVFHSLCDDGVLKSSGEKNEFYEELTLGQLAPIEQRKTTSKPDDVFQLKSIPSTSWSDRIVIHRESEKSRFEKQHEIIGYGNKMHKIFERMTTSDDLTTSLRRSVLDGELSDDELQTLSSDIAQKLTTPQISKWFDGSMREVYTETSFMSADADFRPDRIMIDADGRAVVVDYKFGLTHTRSHEAQVRNYIRLMRKTGFTDVRGFLWYYTENKVVEVE